MPTSYCIKVNILNLFSASAVSELSKDRLSNKDVKQIESHTQNFLGTMEKVESELSGQITHLSQAATSEFCVAFFLANKPYGLI